jgi:hypothetical protein
MPPTPWNTDGPNRSLYAAQQRIGAEPIRVNRLERDPEIYKLNEILGNLCFNYKAAMRNHGQFGLTTQELQNAADTLKNAEKRIERLAIMLIAGMEMVAEATTEFGFDLPARSFAIMVGADAVAAQQLIAGMPAAAIDHDPRMVAAMAPSSTETRSGITEIPGREDDPSDSWQAQEPPVSHDPDVGKWHHRGQLESREKQAY